MGGLFLPWAHRQHRSGQHRISTITNYEAKRCGVHTIKLVGYFKRTEAEETPTLSEHRIFPGEDLRSLLPTLSIHKPIARMLIHNRYGGRAVVFFQF